VVVGRIKMEHGRGPSARSLQTGPCLSLLPMWWSRFGQFPSMPAVDLIPNSAGCCIIIRQLFLFHRDPSRIMPTDKLNLYSSAYLKHQYKVGAYVVHCIQSIELVGLTSSSICDRVHSKQSSDLLHELQALKKG